MRVVIVGAGMAGLACADALVAAGHDVALFDKGRRAGGRMSTRSTTVGGLPVQFDHGAQYFTARDPAFIEQVGRWEAVGVASRWPAAGDDAWVGTPGMRDPVRAMAERHRVTWDGCIDALAYDGTAWTAAGIDATRYDAAVVAVPAEQAGPLLAAHRSDFAARAAATRSEPCWTAIAAFPLRLAIDADIVRDAGAIGWAARDSAKPGRGTLETWVIQATPSWSRAHLEDDADDVAPALLGLLAAHVGMPLPEPLYSKTHRWRYARSGGRRGPGGLWDAAIGLGVCGDWLADPRVEAAWRSGQSVARLICTQGKVKQS